MVPMMLTVVGTALRPASVTVTTAIPLLLVVARFAANVWLSRKARSTATAKTTLPSTQATRRGVTVESRVRTPWSQEMLI
jgi:hypothetical protein